MPCFYKAFFLSPDLRILDACRNILFVITCVVLLFSQASLLLWSSAKKLSYHCTHYYSTQAHTDTIVLAANDRTITWTETDEIRYGNNMFDIEQRIETGDNILLIGHYDGWDNKLYNFLFNILEDDDNDLSNSGPSGSILWIYDAVLVNAPVYQLSIIPFARKLYHAAITPFFNSVTHDTDINPPEV